jgi:hypothetical protein
MRGKDRSKMGRSGSITPYVATVFYSGIPDAELDTFVDSIARINRGKWSSSGCNYTSATRDLRYSFHTEQSAHAFRREVLSTDRGIIRSRVDLQRGLEGAQQPV